MCHVWTAPAVQERTLTFPRIVRVQPCIWLSFGLGKEFHGCVPLLGAFASDMAAGPPRDRSNRQSASSPAAESFSSRVPRSRGQRSLRHRASPRIRAPDARILGSAEAIPAFRAHRCPMASSLTERSMAWRAAFRKYSMAFSVSPA